MVGGDGQGGVAAAAQLGGQRQRSLGPVHEVVVADVSDAAVVNEETIASPAGIKEYF